MKPRNLSYSALATVITVACSLLASNSVLAANASWLAAPTSNTWNDSANWSAAFPNATGESPTFNVVSTFGGVANPVTPSANVTIQNMNFAGTAGPYVVGVNGAFSIILRGTGTGSGNPPTFNNSINVAAAVTNPQVVAAPLSFSAPSSTTIGYAIKNDSTTSSAALTLSGAITTNTASNRNTTLSLDGGNTGANTISGAITATGTTVNPGPIIQKVGLGTWILSGANTLTSNGMTNTGGTQGIQVNAGVLSIQNAAALGSSATANNYRTWINSGGTLELANSIILDNGVSLELKGGGIIRSSGTNTTNGRVNVGTVAATSVTLSTVGSADEFTVGNGANDVSGGAADSVIHVSGPGTIIQNFASNYAGAWSVDSGVLRLGSPTALGSLASVSVASGAKLQTFGSSPTIGALSGSGLVTNGTAGVSTVTANIATSNTFAGQFQDGVAGTLALTKTGVGTLNLTGVNTYTDATLVNTGMLNVTGSLGTTAVSGASGAILAGSGSIAGGVTIGSGVHIAPGDGGDAALGTLSVGTLFLDFGSQLDFGITNTTTLDKITVTSSGGLSVGGGQVNINGGTTPFTTNGTYPLISHTGPAITNINSILTVNGLNKSVAKTYKFTDVGGFVNLVVSDSGVVQKFWNVNSDGNWSTGANWTTSAAPNAVGAFAGLGGGGTEITADHTVTVDGAFTVGTLAFNGAANGKSYTLAAGSGASITLDNGATEAFVTDSSGSHVIGSPLATTVNGATFTVLNGADTLTVNGVISGDGLGLSKGGAGTLALYGANTYTFNTVINGGTVLINSESSLGDVANTTEIKAGTLRATADIASARSLSIGDSASTISVAPGMTYTVSGTVGDGAVAGVLNKVDSGTLALSGSNMYSGGTVINAGTVLVNSANSLGTGPATINGATLQVTTGFASARNFTLGSATSTVSVDPSQTYTMSGVISGSGKLNKIGTGTLSLGSNANTYSGGTVLNAGILALNAGSFLGPGTLTFQGGTLQNNYGNNNTYGLGNPIFVATGQVGTINMNNRMSIGAGAVVTGGGTLNVNLNTTVTRDDINNSWTGFTGQVNFAGSGTGRLLNNSGTFDTNSFANCSVDVGGSAFLQTVTNTGGNTYPFGALSGSSSTAGFSGATAGTATLSVGALNTSTTFAGQINGNTALTKVGTGALALSGTNGYTGNTTVNAGATLVLTASGQLKFVPGLNGVSNKITGAGTVNLDGGFNIDLTTANTTGGNSWLLVDVGTLTETYGGTFSVVGFSHSGTTWTKVDGGKTWTFEQTTGVLSLTSVGYASWTADPANGLTAGVNDGATLDPDADGISNLLEYVLGGIPAGAGGPNTSILPTQTLDATDLTLTFHRSDLSESDVVLKAQWSADLVTWTDFVTVGAADALPAVDVTEDSPSASLDTVVVKIPRSGREAGGKLYGRVQAVK